MPFVLVAVVVPHLPPFAHQSPSSTLRCICAHVTLLWKHLSRPTHAQDTDEEFVILFMVSDENQSHYLQTNIDKYGGDPENEVSGPRHDRQQGR